ncbi:serine protease [Methylobacterium sp. J-078]|uniref:serine protease n=1 Tax=Methylobacterium sp. J-078 TaxID=2836657 RepID=UPI001FB9F172|nr:serine protease [Methylobacterium sp. J-078]MCJ2044237.1 serine protease [Methylobacterium sp. J-078]
MISDVDEVSFLPGHPVSYTTTQIVCYFNDQKLASATAFVLQFAGQYGLITNWHVLTGRSPIDGKCLSKTGGIPNNIKFHVVVSWPDADGPDKGETLFFKPMHIELYKDNDFLDPIWFDDRDRNSQSDFCLILLNDRIPELKEAGSRLRAIQGGNVAISGEFASKPSLLEVPKEAVRRYYPAVGRQVFVVGYPVGISFSNVFPIWKGATIASEPLVSTNLSGYITNEVFLVDGLTRSGMSGAPVIRLLDPDEPLFTEGGGTVLGKNRDPLLLGVYAGREGVTTNEADLALGRVWKVGAIEELFMKALN